MTVLAATRARWRPAAVPASAAVLEAAGISPRLAPLLARRGVEDAEAAERFLQPSSQHLHDPFLLAGLREAVDRLLAARERGERVAIVGDYDVDGVSSTALLSAVFSLVGIDSEAILPHRLHDGYGFQPVHVERAREAGCSLILTADCGTTAVAAVTAAREAGIDVVVTDHHLSGDATLPAGTIQINPKQPDCSYPFVELAAVGLALKLALGLLTRAGRSEAPLEALLRMACLGTIADLVPLVDENRVIAALGLAGLARTPSVGLQALFRKAGLQAPFSATDVGFRIGPRLNAAGRLADAGAALELLLTRDAQRAEALAETLDRWNRQRQDEEQRVVEEARTRLEAAGATEPPPIAVLWREGWHRGVVGIAAGRIARDLHRPALLLAVEGDAATGSGRSISGIDLYGFLQPWKRRLARFGGHTQAVGLTADLDALPALAREWQEAAAAWPDELLRRTYEWELELPAGGVGPELLAELSQLEPHGIGNRRPLLKVGPLELLGPPRLFGKGHLSAIARGADGASVRLLGWRWAEREDDLAGAFEALGYVEPDTYRGGQVLRLVDARPAHTAGRASSYAKTEPGP